MQSFVLRVEIHARSIFPEETKDKSSDDLRKDIGDAIQLGKKFGLTRECDVEGYLNVVYGLAADASRPPAWIQQVLQNQDIPAEYKIEWLYKGYRNL